MVEFEVDMEELLQIVNENQELIHHVIVAVDTEDTGPFTKKVCGIEYIVSLGTVILKSSEIIEWDSALRRLAAIQDISHRLIGEEGIEVEEYQRMKNETIELLTQLNKKRLIKEITSLFKTMDKETGNIDSFNEFLRRFRDKIVSLSLEYREELIKKARDKISLRNKPVIRFRGKKKNKRKKV